MRPSIEPRRLQVVTAGARTWDTARPLSGILAMFRSVRFYSLASPWLESEQELSAKLAGAAFRPCGPYAERSSGFEPPTGSDELGLARRVGGADHLRLRSQARVLPAAALNEALEVRLE